MSDVLARLEEDKVTELARDIVTNRIFITQDVQEIQMCFIVLAFGADLPPNIGAVYEYLSEAGPMAVNGLPMFFSARFVPQEDLPALADKIDTMRKALGL